MDFHQIFVAYNSVNLLPSKRKDLIKMKPRLKNIESEFKNIRTIELASADSLFIEKLFWIILGILGTAWAFYFVPSNIQVWKDNPTIKSQGNMDLLEIKSPAISVTPSGITKYAIAERLGNYLDPQDLPMSFRQLFNEIMKCAMIYKNGYASNFGNGVHIPDSYYYDDYYVNCLMSSSKTNPDKLRACKVSSLSL